MGIRSKVGKKAAVSAAATPTVVEDDPLAVAGAAKKADDAMDALLVSHTVRNPP